MWRTELAVSDRVWAQQNIAIVTKPIWSRLGENYPAGPPNQCGLISQRCSSISIPGPPKIKYAFHTALPAHISHQRTKPTLKSSQPTQGPHCTQNLFRNSPCVRVCLRVFSQYETVAMAMAFVFQIRAAYLRKAKESHPDLAAPAERERAEAEFKAVGNRPYRIELLTVQRKQYKYIFATHTNLIGASLEFQLAKSS